MSRWNCLSISGGRSIGSLVMTLIKVSKAFVHSSVQRNGLSFFVSLRIGLAILEKFGMKGCWYPMTPMVLRTSPTFFSSLGQFLSPSTLAGSGLTVPPSTIHPKKSTLRCKKRHLDSFKKYDFFLNTVSSALAHCLCLWTSAIPLLGLVMIQSLR